MKLFLRKYIKKKYIKQKDKPLKSLKSVIEKSKVNFPNFLPPMSTALIGYLGYETIEQFEKIPERKSSELILPDGFFIRPSIMAIFDSLKNQLTITTPSWYEKNMDLKRIFK